MTEELRINRESTTEEWATKVSNELNDLTETSWEKSERWKKQSIYKVPSSVTDLCSNAYKPQTVSIGPYHHGEKHLEAMEEHKHRALLNFLKRSKEPLRYYINALARAAEDLKDAYDQLDRDKWQQDTGAFLQVMIVDGCFVLELLQTSAGKEMGYAENDPVFSNHGRIYIVPYLKRDMLMLENQLPMQVLTTLLGGENDVVMTNGFSKQREVTKLILEFFSQPHDIVTINNLGKCFHMLDVYRKSLLLAVPRQKPQPRQSSCLWSPHKNSRTADAYIRSATELDEAGIRFKKSKTRSLNDIFFHDGVLELPPIVFDDALEPQYLNLMAFERFHVGAGNSVTAYVFFMDKLIDKARDVSLLHSCGIIQNAMGSDKAVAKLFNSLSKDIVFDPDSCLSSVHKQVSEYCSKPWPRWKASLKHNYFTNPWAIISVIAAVYLFALATVQTVITILSYVPK